MKRSLSHASLLAGLAVTAAPFAFAQTAATAPSSSASAAASTPVTAPATAAPSGPTKVAIILFQQAVAQTNEGKRDLEEVEKKYQPKQTQLKQQSDEIDTLKKQLQTQSATLTDTERAQKLKSIDDKEKSLQRSGEDAQNDFQQEIQQTYAQVAQKVFGTVQSYAQQNGYTLVLDASQQQSPILYATQGNDITEAVIAAYNTKSGIAAPPPSAPSATPRTGTTGSAPTRRATPPAAH